MGCLVFGVIALDLSRNPTRSVRIGSISLGAGHPIAVQSMTATHTQNVDATVAQVNDLVAAGADVVRIAVDNQKDAEALREIRGRTRANLSVDLQENYRLATKVAPYVNKVRYNPGHLYHHEREKPWQEKVKFLADVAGENDCAMRVGVNCGSVDPAKLEKYEESDSITPMLESAWEHCELLDARLHALLRLAQGFRSAESDRGESSLRRAAPRRAAAPGRDRSRHAARGNHQDARGVRAIDQSRHRRHDSRFAHRAQRAQGEEIAAGRQILADIAAGRVRSVVDYGLKTLNIISCPSCSRVENEAFIELAQDVKELTRYAADYAITIAVMGCRVNGPGETDDADLGLWCGPNFVNLKRGSAELGAYPYDAILPRLKQELDELIAGRVAATGGRG